MPGLPGKVSRRQAIGLLGASAGVLALGNPLLSLFKSIVRGEGSSLGGGLKTYVHVFSFRAPARWQFDQFLNPYGSELFVPHPYFVATKGRYVEHVHDLRPVKGLLAPPIWGEPISGRDGAPLYSTLLDNLLSIQGIDVGSSDHESAARNLVLPPGWAKGVPDILGELGEGVLPPVGLDCEVYPFDARNPRQPLLLRTMEGENVLNRLLKPFDCRSVRENEMVGRLLQPEFQAALGELNQIGGKGPLVDQLSRESLRAVRLFQDCVADLDKKWDELYAKYDRIVRDAIRYVSAGVNDRPIGSPDMALREASADYTMMRFPITNPDIRSALGPQARLPDMAAQFAVAEYLTVNRLTSSVVIQPSHFVNVSLRESGGRWQSWEINHDQHNIGVHLSLLVNHYYFRALGACLVGFVDTLKKVPSPKGSAFDNVLIQVGAEFNRVPKDEGGGSEHGWKSAGVTYLSGCIRGPTLLGTVYDRDSGRPECQLGSTGQGAPLAEIGGKLAGVRNLNATTLTLLGLEDPMLREHSLVRLEAGKVTSRIGKFSIIPEEKAKEGYT